MWVGSLRGFEHHVGDKSDIVTRLDIRITRFFQMLKNSIRGFHN